MTGLVRWSVALLALLALPWLAGDYWVSLVTQMFIFGLLALATDLLLGHAGLFSLCHAAFFSVAAYASAILQVRYGFGSLSGMACGVMLGTLLGSVFGLAVRTRGVYFILVTLAMGYVIWGVGYRWSALTGGDSGITNVPPLQVAGVTVESGRSLYYVIMAVMLVILVLYSRWIQSPFGLALRGIKSGEPRMKSLGFSPPRHLYLAFVLSSLLASLAGVLYVCFNKFVNPVSASLHVNVESVLMAIVGGSGTMLGPFLGAGLILGLRNWVSTFFELHLAVMGLVFIAVVIWAPGGVIGMWRRLDTSRRERP